MPMWSMNPVRGTGYLRCLARAGTQSAKAIAYPPGECGRQGTSYRSGILQLLLRPGMDAFCFSCDGGWRAAEARRRSTG